MRVPSDQVPGVPCAICGKPTRASYIDSVGGTVYHAACLKKHFPNMTMLQHINEREEEDSECGS